MAEAARVFDTLIEHPGRCRFPAGYADVTLAERRNYRRECRTCLQHATGLERSWIAA